MADTSPYRIIDEPDDDGHECRHLDEAETLEAQRRPSGDGLDPELLTAWLAPAVLSEWMR